MKDILDDEILDSGMLFEDDVEPYQLAGRDSRFINFLVDYFATIILLGIFGFVAAAMNINLPIENNLFMYPLIWTIRSLYYIVCEHYLNGKTLGKFLTRTRAVTIFNKRLSLKEVCIRSISRLVPFEPFSFLGDYGWHDKWSDSMVIKAKNHWQQPSIK